MRSRLLLRRLLWLLEEIEMPIPLAGERANRPFFFAALNSSSGQNVSNAKGTNGVIYEIRASNVSGGGLATLTAFDDNGQFDTLLVPGGETAQLSYGGRSGAQYVGQLVVKTDNPLDVTVVVL